LWTCEPPSIFLCTERYTDKDARTREFVVEQGLDATMRLARVRTVESTAH
jgi:hypothetical protein